MIDGIWALCQILTVIAYFHIPYEIRQWTKGVDLNGLHMIASCFVAFIVFCGAHHAMMIYTMHHDINPLQLVSDIPMALFSVGTSVVLLQFRDVIRAIIHREIARNG